ncbi:MAG: hypothetical protein ACLTKQ_07035 [Acutalibacteraceae bacterium]
MPIIIAYHKFRSVVIIYVHKAKTARFQDSLLQPNTLKVGICLAPVADRWVLSCLYSGRLCGCWFGGGTFSHLFFLTQYAIAFFLLLLLISDFPGYFYF